MQTLKFLMISGHQVLWDQWNSSHFTVKVRYSYTYVQQETELQSKDTLKVTAPATIFTTWIVSSYPLLTSGLQYTKYSLCET